MTTKRNSGMKKVLIPVAAVAGAAVVATTTVLACRALWSNESAEGASQASSAVVNEEVLARGFVEDEDTAANIVEGMKDKVADGMFECMMTTSWTFADGTSEAPNAYVANAQSNKYTFYFDVILEDTGEVVYSSPLIPVGSEIKGITLDKDLDAGEYSMKVQYTMVDENYQEVNTVGFMITATVRN